MNTILTIGHSSLSLPSFIRRLKAWDVSAVADVRSSPFSRSVPHFNRPELKASLSSAGLSYAFLGRELGGRPSDPSLYTQGIADYRKMAATPEFRHGLDRVEKGAQLYRVALMCSEHSPYECHRCLLVGRELSARGLNVENIISDHEAIFQHDIEHNLLKLSGKSEKDLFASADEQVDQAYWAQSRKFAYSAKGNRHMSSMGAEWVRDV
jgi:uncharacterized protein (DUF488 family)